ncbi:hypothetical protein ACROYT_G019399 [Oculina patagonica]
MRPILSATGTYNFQFAKWLDEKLKPLSTNDHSVDDIFRFADETQHKLGKEGDAGDVAPSSIGKYYRDKHCIVPKDLDQQFHVIKKCKNKNSLGSDVEVVKLSRVVDEGMSAIPALLASGFKQIYINKTDATLQPCPPGTFSNSSSKGQDGCIQCPPGICH